MSKEEEILEAVTAAVGFRPESGIRLSYDPEGPFDVKVAGNRVEVTYAAFDPMPPTDYWGDDRGTFRRFRSADAREKHIRRLIRSGSVVYDIGVTVQGDLYPAAPGLLLDPVGVLALPDRLTEKFREEEFDDGASLLLAHELIAGYMAWSKGESLGVATDVFAVNAGRTDIDYLDHSVRWDVIDLEAAERRIKPKTEERAPEPALIVSL